jgi:hypothetical protein
MDTPWVGGSDRYLDSDSKKLSVEYTQGKKVYSSYCSMQMGVVMAAPCILDGMPEKPGDKG